MKRKLHLFTDGGGGISDKVTNQFELNWYHIIVWIYLWYLATAPDQVFFLAQNTSSCQWKQLGAAPLNITAWKDVRRPGSHLDILCAGDEAYFINNSHDLESSH